MQGVQKIARILKKMYHIPEIAPPTTSPTLPSVVLPARILPPAQTPVSVQPIPSVQTPEERLCQYHLLRERQLAQAPVLVPVPRVDPSPTTNISPQVALPRVQVSLPRVQHKVRISPSPQPHIDEINDLIAQYSKIAKATLFTKKSTPLPLRKPTIPPMHVPTKAINPRRARAPNLFLLNTQLSKLRTLHRNTGTNLKKSAVRQLVAHHIFAHPQINRVLNEINGRRETLSTLLTGDMTETWATSLANKWGRLTKCINNIVVGIDTIDFIHKSEVPEGHKVTYGNFVCDYQN